MLLRDWNNIARQLNLDLTSLVFCGTIYAIDIQLERYNLTVIASAISGEVRSVPASSQGSLWAVPAAKEGKHPGSVPILWTTLLLFFVQTILPFESARAAESQSYTAVLSATADPSPEDVMQSRETLSRQILLKEIELERFNINYRMETGKADRFKHWRYFLSQEASACLTNAGFITIAAERARHINSPGKLNLLTIENGVVVRIVAPFIGMAGSALELGINSWRDYELHRSGFSPQIAKHHVLALRAEIDRLLNERDALLAAGPERPEQSTHADMEKAEGAVLGDIRDLSLVEFERFHIGSRKYKAFERSLYVLDMTNDAILAAINFVSLHAIRTRQAKLDGPVGAMAIVFGGIGIFTPILSRSIGKAVALYDKHFLAACRDNIQTREVAKLDADRERLRELCHSFDAANPGVTCGTLARLGVYESHSKTFRDRLAQAEKEVKAGNRAATENVLAGALVGSSIVGAGAAIATAGYHYPTNARRFNTLVAAGSISVVAGLSLAVLDGVRIQVQNEIVRHRLSRKGLMPSQALQERLRQLDDIEASLKKKPVVSG